MMSFLQILGVLIVVVVIALLVSSERPSGVPAIAALVVVLLAGLALALSDRAIELTIEKVGSIKAAAKQAETKLEEIVEIKKRIDAQAATIDLVAKEATTAKALSEELKQKTEKADEKLRQIDGALEKATVALNTLNQFTAFHTLAMSAQTGNRGAFDEIRKTADDSKSPFRDMALQVFREIMNKNQPAFYMRPGHPTWKEGVDPKQFTLDRLRTEYQNAPALLRPALLTYIRDRHDFAKSDRMQFCIDVLRDEKVDLNLVSLAGRYFAELSENMLMPLAIPEHLVWWEKNKESILTDDAPKDTDGKLSAEPVTK
jgi:hypothetical protein